MTNQTVVATQPVTMNVPKVLTQGALPTIAVTVASYGLLELIHHGLISGYVAPWLLSMGLSASMVAYLTWALVALGAVAVGYLIYKFFIAKDE